MTAASDIRQTSNATGFLGAWLKSPWTSVVIPYAVCILAQTPYLVLYFTQLFKLRPHYQFFPFALIATGLAIYLRWPRNQEHPFRSSFLSSLIFLVACVYGLAAALFSDPWFSAVSAFAFVTSFCARTKDGETGWTLLSASFPLWIALSLPLNLDFSLITWLQVFSAQAASHVLDLLGYHHHLAGTVLTFPERSYGVEEACSGVQSFFTLLFFTTVFVVFMHRPWFRSLLLLFSALFWAVLMNSIRILLIPIAYSSFGIDLAHGFSHAALGYFVLSIGGLLVLSTDQFLTFLFGPVEAATLDSSNEAVGNLTGFWNRVVAGESSEAPAKVRSKLPSRSARLMIAGGAACMLVLGVLSIGTATRMLSSGYIVKFFRDVQPVAMQKNDLKETIGNWRWIPETETNKPYQVLTREKASDMGLRSDTWTYRAGRVQAIISLDQPFPGWHELTRCYQNNGWNLMAQGRQYKEAKRVDGKDWPYIQVEFTRPTGENGFLLFSFFDTHGEPFDAPTEWGAIKKFLVRVKNRLSPEIRERLFNSESYQVQIFIGSAHKLTDEERETITNNYLLLREELRTAFLKRHGEIATEVTTPVASMDAK